MAQRPPPRRGDGPPEGLRGVSTSANPFLLVDFHEKYKYSALPLIFSKTILVQDLYLVFSSFLSFSTKTDSLTWLRS